MKSFLSILGILLISGVTLAAQALPTGTFEGNGIWQALDGSSGEYKSRVVIDAQSLTIEAEYEHDGKIRQERHTMTLSPEGFGFFELRDAKSQPIGQLVCLDDQCSYRARQ